MKLVLQFRERVSSFVTEQASLDKHSLHVLHEFCLCRMYIECEVK